MIKDVTMSQLHLINEEESNYHAFVWSHIKIKERVFSHSSGQWFAAKKLKEMRFSEVIDVRELLSNLTLDNQLKSVSMVYSNVPVNDLAKMKAVKFFALFNYVVKEVKLIVDGEKFLHSEPDGDMQRAGIHKLNRFGILSAVDTLAGGDVLRWEIIMKQRYSRIFAKLCLNKVRSDIENDYAEIMRKKQRR